MKTLGNATPNGNPEGVKPVKKPRKPKKTE